MEEKMSWRLITPGLAPGENPKKVAQVHLEVSVIANDYALKTQCKIHPQVEDKHAPSVFRFCVCVFPRPKIEHPIIGEHRKA